MPEFRGMKHEPMTLEKIAEAFEAMERGERPNEPPARSFDMDEQEITTSPEAIGVEVADSSEAPGGYRMKNVPFASNEGRESRRGPIETGVMKDALKKTAGNEDIEEINRIISDLDIAQKSDRRKNAIGRMQAWNTLAGSAVSTGMGGLKPNEVEMPDKIQKGEQGLKREKLREDLKMGKFRRENPELERQSRELIAGEKNLTAERLAELEENAAAMAREDRQEHESEEGAKNRHLRKLIHDENIRLGIVKGYWGQGQGASKEGARAGAREAYDQARMAKKETKFGQKYYARGPVTAHQSNAADDRLESYSMLVPALEDAAAAVEKDPRGALMYGTETRANLLSAFQAAYQSDIKFQGNGVMNGKDLETAIKVLGDPESTEQLLFTTVGSKLNGYRQRIDRQLDAVLHAVGYSKGEGEQDLSQAQKNVQTLGGGQHGPVVDADPGEAIDFIKGGKAPKAKRNPNAVPESGKAGKTMFLNPQTGKVEYE